MNTQDKQLLKRIIGLDMENLKLSNNYHQSSAIKLVVLLTIMILRVCFHLESCYCKLFYTFITRVWEKLFIVEEERNLVEWSTKLKYFNQIKKLTWSHKNDQTYG